jgi:hypothetical protein
MPSKMSIIATSKLRREMPKPRQILSKPSVAAAAAPIMTHPKTHLIQPDESPNAGSACGTIIDMPTTNTITQPAIDSVAAILILSFHHAIPPTLSGTDWAAPARPDPRSASTGSARTATRSWSRSRAAVNGTRRLSWLNAELQAERGLSIPLAERALTAD